MERLSNIFAINGDKCDASVPRLMNKNFMVRVSRKFFLFGTFGSLFYLYVLETTTHGREGSDIFAC